MQAYSIPPHPKISIQAEALLTYWRQKGIDLPTVQALTPTTQASLLTVLQHILSETGETNIDHQDVWEVMDGATSLQFGMAIGEGQYRTEVAGQQLWAQSTVLGNCSLPAHRLLMVIQSGLTAELEMEELTRLVEYLLDQTDRQAEIVFGHERQPALGESIRLLLLINRRMPLT